MNYKGIDLVAIILGLYLIFEAIASLILLEGDPTYQMGRMFRVVIGVFLVYIGANRMIKWY
jgi:hypothetical protein